jgi:response regulator RpfG family c-di-GMP phosphodiesterase
VIKKNLSKKIKKRILIVDDEPDVNLLFKIVLEENGFVVDSYNEGLVALKNFKADMYDLLYSVIEKNKFITKPIGNDQLVKKVNELLDSN